MAKKMWGGRFGKKTHPLTESFTRSIHFDYKLAAADVLGSLLHVQVLAKSGYLSSSESAKLIRGLKRILKDIRGEKSVAASAEEDIHSYIQNQLHKHAGDVALKLQTARSRNDQVAFATKAYCKNALAGLMRDILEMSGSLVDLADKYKDTVLPGYTHLQHAQPIYLRDYLMAYTAMLERDLGRIEDASARISLTLGAGALAGTPVLADRYNLKVRELIAELDGVALKESGIELKPTGNSLDSVSDRDFVIEIIASLSILAMHLSRFAEDMIIWSTAEFDFVEIDEAFCTGSSLMPQKKNPDVLELVRGYAGRLYGNLVSVLTMMKGLPMTYNRDMQLDKEPLFNSIEIVSSELQVLNGLVKALKFNKEKIAARLKDEGLYATDLVYYLVDKKVPFKQAHTIVGKLVQYSLKEGIRIQDMPEKALKKFSAKFVKSEVAGLFDPVASVESKKSIKRK